MNVCVCACAHTCLVLRGAQSLPFQAVNKVTARGSDVRAVSAPPPHVAASPPASRSVVSVSLDSSSLTPHMGFPVHLLHFPVHVLKWNGILALFTKHE